MKSATATRIFGDAPALYAPILDLVLPQLRLREFDFESNEVWSKREDVAVINQIMWTETFGRAHLAPATSMMRAAAWIHGAIHAAESENIFAISAAIRALLEATGDSVEAFRDLPLTFAEHFKAISRCLSGEYSEGIRAPGEIENQLIHFTFARRITRRARAGPKKNLRNATGRQLFREFRCPSRIFS